MGWPKGKKRSAETRAKMRATHQKRLRDPEARAAMERNLAKGSTSDISDTERARRAELARNRVWSDESKAKVSASLTGLKQSKATRAKRSASLKKAYAEGRHRAPEAITSGANGRRNKGRKQSLAERNRRSEAQRKRWDRDVRHQPATIEKMKEARSKSKPNYRSKLEDKVALLLDALGIAYERNRSLKESGCGRHQWDFVIRDRNLLLEVDGCYWHGCDQCGYEDRYDRRRVDSEQTEKATQAGWRVLRLAEHSIDAGYAGMVIGRAGIFETTAPA